MRNLKIFSFLFLFNLLFAKEILLFPDLSDDTNRTLNFHADSSVELIDRSVKGIMFNSIPDSQIGLVSPESWMDSRIKLYLSSFFNGRKNYELIFSFNRENKIRTTTIPNENFIVASLQELEQNIDYSLWNTLNRENYRLYDNVIVDYNDISLDSLSIYNIGILDQFTMGVSVYENWGDFTFNRQFSGFTGRKFVSIPLFKGMGIGYQVLGGILFNNLTDFYLKEEGKPVFDHSGYVLGVKAGLSVVSNKNFIAKADYSYIRQARDWHLGTKDDPQIRSFYLRIDSTENFDPAVSNSSQFSVLIGDSSNAVQYFNSDAEFVHSYDILPLEETYLDNNNNPGRLLTDQYNSISTTTPGLFTNNIYRSPSEDTSSGVRRRNLVYRFPLSGDDFTIDDVKLIRVRINLKYNYSYSVSFDGVHYEQVDSQSLLSIDPHALRTDLGNGQFWGESRGGNFRLFYGANDIGITGDANDTRSVLIDRVTGFDFDLRRSTLNESRDLHTVSAEIGLPSIGLHLKYNLVQNTLNYYQGSASVSVANYFIFSGNFLSDRLTFTLKGGQVSPRYNTGLNSTVGRVGVNSDRLSSLVSDNDNKIETSKDLEKLTYYQESKEDFKEGYVPGYFYRKDLPIYKINLNPEFSTIIRKFDRNGNGYIDKNENDLYFDYPLLPGYAGAMLNISILPSKNFKIALDYKIQSSETITNSKVRRDESLLVNVMWTLPIGRLFSLEVEAVTGYVADEIEDHLYYQTYTYLSDRPETFEGIYLRDLKIDNNQFYLDLYGQFNIDGDINLFKGKNAILKKLELDVLNRLLIDYLAYGSDFSSQELGTSLLIEGSLLLPFTFLIPLVDFSVEFKTQMDVGFKASNFRFYNSSTLHFIKHFEVVDVFMGLGHLDMNTYPYFFNQRWLQYSVGISGIFKGFSLEASYKRSSVVGKDYEYNDSIRAIMGIRF